MTKALLIALLLAVSASACASATPEPAITTPSTAPTSVVVTVEQSGGCMMMGPNCPTYVIHTDGQVDLLRTGPNSASDEPVDSAHIDPALVGEVSLQLVATDVESLRSRLGPGECRGCYDGTDTRFIFAAHDGDVVFDSINEELPTTEPLFAAVWKVVEASIAATEMPLKEHP